MSTVSWDSVDVCLTVSAATHTNSWHVLGLIIRSLIILHAVYVDVLLKMQDWRTQEARSFRKLRTLCWNLLWVHSWVTSHNSISSTSCRGSLGSRSLCSLVRITFSTVQIWSLQHTVSSKLSNICQMHERGDTCHIHEVRARSHQGGGQSGMFTVRLGIASGVSKGPVCVKKWQNWQWGPPLTHLPSQGEVNENRFLRLTTFHFF